jgi:hypothetical protein
MEVYAERLPTAKVRDQPVKLIFRERSIQLILLERILRGVVYRKDPHHCLSKVRSA